MSEISFSYRANLTSVEYHHVNIVKEVYCHKDCRMSENAECYRNFT